MWSSSPSATTEAICETGNEHDVVFLADGNSSSRADRRRPLVGGHRFTHVRRGGLAAVPAARAARARDAAPREPRLGDRLRQVVHRIHFKRLDRMLVVGRDEDHERQVRRRNSRTTLRPSTSGICTSSNATSGSVSLDESGWPRRRWWPRRRSSRPEFGAGRAEEKCRAGRSSSAMITAAASGSSRSPPLVRADPPSPCRPAASIVDSAFPGPARSGCRRTPLVRSGATRRCATLREPEPDVLGDIGSNPTPGILDDDDGGDQ